jgi:P4 family phage/plasmid primase-like protien
MESIRNLPQFLNASRYTANALSGEQGYTHTRIGEKDLNIYGGCYTIDDENLTQFWNLYYNHVFTMRQPEYLTEKQLKEGGPIMIDLDFRYAFAIENKQHNEETITDIISCYLDAIEEIFDISSLDQSVSIPIYVMEKSRVNRVEEKNITKDGIHIIIGLKTDEFSKVLIRNKVLQPLSKILKSLPLINPIDDIVDRGVAEGTTGWQVYGSRKPKHQPYELIKYYQATLEVNEEDTTLTLMLEPQSITNFDLKTNIHKLSARYSLHPELPIHENSIADYNSLKDGSQQKKLKNRMKTSTSNSNLSEENEIVGYSQVEENKKFIPLSEITNVEILNNQVSLFISSLKSDEHYIKETHEFTQILPAKFYEPGSHDLNTKIAFALKNTDERLFLSWILLRSKASDFNYSDIPALKKRWNNHLNSKEGSTVLTRRTIMYYAKQENPEEYQQILEHSSEYYIQLALRDGSDWDLAMVVYQLFKDKYVCANIEKKIWYQFRDHRWIEDKGASLRKVISVEVYKKFDVIRQQRKKEMKALDKECNALKNAKKKNKDDTLEEGIQEKLDQLENLKSLYKTVDAIAMKLKTTGNKSNLLTEAATLFYDSDFIVKADSDTKLMCFSNGVWDFSEFQFREGLPQDYITKCTNIPYIPQEDRCEEFSSNILTFMEQLFPLPGLNRYMWHHLASCLVGGNKNQTFNIYLGKGSNGKSKLAELMSQAFGDYKGTVPISLVTEKRNGIGGTSSEVIQLKGVRYAVMQEPDKNHCKLNEGVMKELTGGDPIVARGLYKDSETFVPQLNLVVCSNILFEVDSTDSGTWRRIRVCKFLSKFVDKNDIRDEDDKYIFERDYELDNKIKIWASTFMSMLVSMYCETKGSVEDCEEVLEESRKYQQAQNVVDTFFNECLEHVPEGDPLPNPLTARPIYTKFKAWAEETYGRKTNIKLSELTEAMEKRYKKPNKKGWNNVRFIQTYLETEYDADI